jgi:uncharacterized membrane protein
VTGATWLARVPTGPAFTVVLVCHVAVVLVGMVTLAAAGVSAARLVAARSGELPSSVRGYFSPGRSWAGRVLWLVPALGAALLGMSAGDYRLGQGWVAEGLALWALVIALCEVVLWPAERRVRAALADAPSGPAPVAAVHASRVVLASSTSAFILLVAATVVMVARP